MGFGDRYSKITNSYNLLDEEVDGLKRIKLRLDSILVLPTGNMSKKVLKKHEEEVNSFKSVYNDYVFRISKVRETLDDISNSLKTAMKSNDDF